MSSPSYDWGLPQPTPQPAAKNRKSRVIMTVVAVVAVVAVVVVGAAVAASSILRPSATGPLGWDDDSVAHHFDYDELRHCALGSEFYNSVGLKDVVGAETSCAGWTVAPDGQPSLRVEIDTDDEAKAPDNVVAPGLEEWSQEIIDPRVEVTFITDNRMCRLTSDEPGLKNVSLRTMGWCEPLYPLAQQLTNLARQNEHILDDPGLFERSERPEFVEVAALNYDVYGPDWETRVNEALPVGESTTYDGDDYAGKELVVHEIGPDTAADNASEICVPTTFTLGTRNDRFSRGFQTPVVTLLFPGNISIDLQRRPDRITLREGESADLEYCGTLPSQIRDVDYLIEATFAGSTQTWSAGQPAEEEHDA